MSTLKEAERSLIDEELAAGKNPRAAKTRQPRKRRNYAEELRQLQARVEMALRLLGRACAEATGTANCLIVVAVETLEGK